MTKKQIEYLVDVSKTVGLASLIGCIADGFVDGTRVAFDAIGIIAGIVSLYLGFKLTTKLTGSKI
ncbi:hypothetical protein HY522_10375 [bacterium]|nr:hypothetical protein [bacterium]